MCAADHIDRICSGLKEAEIDFSSEMTSNGSLFTEDLAYKEAHVWNISKIQITLDGMAEEYARRKRYTGAIKKPFETVINNIHLLVAAGCKRQALFTSCLAEFSFTYAEIFSLSGLRENK